MVDRRLRSKAYKQRSTMAALQNVEPVRPGGFLSRKYDKPRRESQGIMGFIHKGEDRRMRRADFYSRRASQSQRNVLFGERNKWDDYKRASYARSAESHQMQKTRFDERHMDRYSQGFKIDEKGRHIPADHYGKSGVIRPVGPERPSGYGKRYGGRFRGVSRRKRFR